jgi:hypothetical protein
MTGKYIIYKYYVRFFTVTPILQRILRYFVLTKWILGVPIEVAKLTAVIKR